MKIVIRHLAREIYGATGMVLVAFLGLFGFFDFVNELDSIGKRGYELHQAVIYVLLLVPGRIYELLPIAVLIGTLYALTTLARHSELTVMRVSGLSTGRMLKILVGIGSGFVVLTFVMGEYIAPPAERTAQQFRLEATQSSVSQDLRSGLWVKDGTLFINVRTLTADRALEGVRIYEFDQRQGLRAIGEAKHGVYVGPEQGWKLTNVSQTLFGPEGTTSRTLPELSWHSELTPEVLSVLMVVPERMSVATLYTYSRHLEENQQKSSRYEIALWKKLVYPFAALVMMGLALPFAYTHDRMGGVSVKVFAGIMIGIGFHLLNGLASNLAVINSWSPLLAAVLPSGLFLLAAAGMLLWVEHR